jgi:predicted amidophosphoribosyltransferase
MNRCADSGRSNEVACGICGSPTPRAFADCYCCRTIHAQLGAPLVPVVTVTDYVVGDAMHHLLRGYKDGPTGAIRDLRARAVAARVDAWLRGVHASGDRLGTWDLVTAVPSSRRRGAPAESLIALIDELSERYRPLLSPGPVAPGHLRAVRNGFALARDDVDGRRQLGRVLVFDDSLTTGATAQSAAFVLRRAGYGVAGILAAGRARRVQVG